MTSWLVIFRAFLFIFFLPPNPKSEKKNPRKSTNKNILALATSWVLKSVMQDACCAYRMCKDDGAWCIQVWF